MTVPEWDDFDLGPLVFELRENVGGPDGEKMIWAFEHALAAGRVDHHLLEYLLAAVTCLLAGAGSTTPRTILEQFFRRCVSDAEWRERYAPLILSA